MKKKLTAAAALLACVFAFAACSSRVTVALNRNWQTTAGGGYETFYERLTYDVRFEAPDSSSINNLTYANVSGTYTVTTQSVATHRTENGIEANNVYHLTSVLEVSASVLENGELVYAFGGDTGAPADTITTSVWFRDTLDGMTPLESTTTTYSHTPQNGNIFICSYTTKTVYNEDASRATVTVTDNSDSIAETLPEENSRVFVRTVEEEEKSFSDLTDRYSVFDTAQLIFSARGLAFEADSSNTVTVVSGAAGGQYVTLSCSEVVARNYSFTMDGQPLPDTGTGSGSEEGTDGEEGSEGEEETTGTSISTCVVNFAVSGPNNGQTHTVDYAARSTNASNNRYRNLPMRIEMNLAYGMGAFLYVLQDASYTAPSGE